MIHSETFDTWSKGALAFKPNPDYGFFMRSNHMTRVLCGTIINASFPCVETYNFLLFTFLFSSSSTEKSFPCHGDTSLVRFL